MPGGGGHAQVHCRGRQCVGLIVRLHLYTWKNKRRLALPDMGTLTYRTLKLAICVSGSAQISSISVILNTTCVRKPKDSRQVQSSQGSEKQSFQKRWRYSPV